MVEVPIAVVALAPIKTALVVRVIALTVANAPSPVLMLVKTATVPARCIDLESRYSSIPA
jgi:hypothetical protein